LVSRVQRLEDSDKRASEAIARVEEQLKHVATKTWILGGVLAVMVAFVGTVVGILPTVARPLLNEAVRAALPANVTTTPAPGPSSD